MSDFQVRALTESNAGHMAQIHANCFSKPWDRAFFKDRLNTTCLAEGVFQGDILRGFILMQIIDTEGEILTFCLNENYRGQGLGLRLLEKMMQQSKIHTCFLEVNISNQSAISLYERVGFQIKGVRKGYYINSKVTPQDALTYCYSKKPRVL